MIIAALTGSIAMGKSEAARLFASRGLPVFDSDAEVHKLYETGGDAAKAIAVLVPEAMTGGAVDRTKLARLVLADPGLISRIEDIVHPLVRDRQAAFLDAARLSGAALAVLDIPLLFETGREKEADHIIVVSAPPEMQRARAMKRPGMTQEKLNYILSRQMPDAVKRAKAHDVIDTSGDLSHTAQQVDRIIGKLLDPGGPPHDTRNHP